MGVYKKIRLRLAALLGMDKQLCRLVALQIRPLAVDAAYGWIWVNDEPWGWATYHHGRWFYDDGYWSWSPYGYYRPSRSWWEPALVVISVVSTNICWYPLAYNHHRYNYNWNYNREHHRGGDNDRDRGSAGVRGRVKDSKPDPNDLSRRKPVEDIEGGPGSRVPPSGVVSVNSNEFGTRTGSARRAPASDVRAILSRKADNGDLPTLPVYSEQRRRIRPDVLTDKPAVDSSALGARVGAAVRKADKPLDNELRTTTFSAAVSLKGSRMKGKEKEAGERRFQRVSPHRARWIDGLSSSVMKRRSYPIAIRREATIQSRGRIGRDSGRRRGKRHRPRIRRNRELPHDLSHLCVKGHRRSIHRSRELPHGSSLRRNGRNHGTIRPSRARILRGSSRRSNRRTRESKRQSGGIRREAIHPQGTIRRSKKSRRETILQRANRNRSQSRPARRTLLERKRPRTGFDDWPGKAGCTRGLLFLLVLCEDCAVDLGGIAQDDETQVFHIFVGH